MLNPVYYNIPTIELESRAAKFTNNFKYLRHRHTNTFF